MLHVENLTVAYGDLTILNGVSFDLAPGEWLMIVGPNGAGKSTLINAVTGGAPTRGRVLFEGKDTRAMKPHELARGIGVLSQSHFVGYSFTVEEVVRLGRYSHAPGIFSRRSDADEERVAEALALTGLTDLAAHSVFTLSGGELQRAFLAQIFAQDPKILILDEPTNHLDLVYQREVFTLIRKWLETPGRAVLSVVHDLSLARAYGTDAVLLSKGRAMAAGSVETVFAPEHLNAVYDMDVADWMRRMLAQWQES